MIEIEITEKPDSNWNERLIQSNFATIYQTKEWGDVVSNIGQIPKFIKFLDNEDNIIGQILISEKQRTFSKQKLSNLLKKIPILKKSVYTWTYGPIFFKTTNSSEYFMRFLESLNGKISGWTHPFQNTNLHDGKKNLDLVPWSTYAINLKKPLNELYSNIDKHSGRKNIERSKRREIIIEFVNEKNLSEYADLYNSEHKSDKVNQINLDHLEKTWKILSPLGYSGMLARKNDKAVGGLLFSYLNKHIIEGGLARSKFDYENKLYSQDYIKWKIIEWGVENKMNYYNIAGFNPQASSSKEIGISRYKKKWGGEQFNYWGVKK